MKTFSPSPITFQNVVVKVHPRIGPRIALVLSLMILLDFGWISFTWAKTYYGQVIDEETGKPLEGAVVVVIWHKKPMVTMDGPEYFHDAKETLTDAEGKFTLDASPGVDWNPFTVIKEPNIVIYQPGYEPFALLRTLTRHGFHTFEEVDEAFQNGAVIKLPKLKTREELRKFADASSLAIGGDVPFKKVPDLVRLLNVQAKMAGLTSFY